MVLLVTAKLTASLFAHKRKGAKSPANRVSLRLLRYCSNIARRAAKSLIQVHLCVNAAVCGDQINVFRAGTGVSGVNGGRRLCHSVADS